jgi:uncharacterized membrane protein YfcA
MIEAINSFHISTTDWLLFIACGMLLGMAKTGLSGAGLMVVPIMAGIFGGRASVGIVLPMLIIADVFAVKYYNRHADWKYVIRLVPWAFLGILAGLVFGHLINDKQFTQTIAVLVTAGIGLMVWQDIRRNKIKVPDYWWFAALLGIAGGFTSMIGNAAGPVFSLYLLSMRLPKNIFIGTGAWFYFILNLMKLPFHIISWKTVTLSSLFLDSIAVPAIFGGAIIGIYTVKIIPEKGYRIFIIISTLVSALFLF